MGLKKKIQRRVYSWLNAVSHKAVILLYHRVARLASDPQLLSVTPEHFEQHLQIIKKYFQPLSLAQLVESGKRYALPKKGVAITFDDGYPDNFTTARALLEKHGIPATFFVTTGMLGSDTEFWWDELERLLLIPGVLPSALKLQINGQEYTWNMQEYQHYTPLDYERFRDWHILNKELPTERHHAYCDLCLLISPLAPMSREKVLEQLRSWAGQDKSGRHTYQMVTPETLLSVKNNALIAIGAHTISHPVLRSLPLSEQRQEIMGSKKHLEDIMGQTIDIFSYPFGGRQDYAGETVDLVKECGYRGACSNFPGLVKARVNRLELPRHIVRNWDGDVLLHHIQEWYRG